MSILKVLIPNNIFHWKRTSNLNEIPRVLIALAPSAGGILDVQLWRTHPVVDNVFPESTTPYKLFSWVFIFWNGKYLWNNYYSVSFSAVEETQTTAPPRMRRALTMVLTEALKIVHKNTSSRTCVFIKSNGTLKQSLSKHMEEKRWRVCQFYLFI